LASNNKAAKLLIYFVYDNPVQLLKVKQELLELKNKQKWMKLVNLVPRAAWMMSLIFELMK